MKSILHLTALCLTLCLSARASSNIQFFEGELDDLQQQASEYGKMSLVYFYASWCMPCQWMEKNTYQNTELAEYLNQYYFPIRVNIDAPDGLREKKKYQVTLLPTILIFDNHGNLMARYEESLSPERLLNLLQKHNRFPSGKSNNISRANSPMLHPPQPKNIYFPPLIPEQTPAVAASSTTPANTFESVPPTAQSGFTINQTYAYSSAPEYYFGVQVGAFSSKQNADRELKILRAKIKEPLHLITENLHNRKIFKIIAGKFIEQNQAIQCLNSIKQQKIFGFVKKIDNPS